MENNAISSDLIRGHIDTIILYSLIEGQKTSQQIIDSVLIKSDNKYQLNQATLYSSLKRLESLKLISSVWHDAEDGRRKFFNLTENGKNTVEQNLSNWEYSRAIIDKLIGFNGGAVNDNQVNKVIEVEKIIEKPVYIEKIVEKEVPVYVSSKDGSKDSIKNSETDKFNENNSDLSKNTEINFRNILNGLIKATEKQKNEEVSEIDIAKDSQIKSFNDTINDSADNSFKNTSNKIDFTDLKEKVEADGYKLRISSKENGIKTGTLFINKLNFYSALAITLLCLTEFLIFALFTKGIVNYSAFTVIIPVLIIAIFPAITAVIYYKKPLKTALFLKKDGILYSAIVAFNLILFTIVANLLFNVDFSDAANLSVYLVVPLLITVDIVLYFVLRYYMSRNKIFSVKSAIKKQIKK